jgi:hypothetical protein
VAFGRLEKGQTAAVVVGLHSRSKIFDGHGEFFFDFFFHSSSNTTSKTPMAHGGFLFIGLPTKHSDCPSLIITPIIVVYILASTYDFLQPHCA